MAGQFYVDKEGLRSAVRDLQTAQDRMRGILAEADRLLVGELTAKDMYTGHMRDTFNQCAAGPRSIQATLDNLIKIVDQKINAYNATITEYEQAEEHSTVHRGHIDV